MRSKKRVSYDLFLDTFVPLLWRKLCAIDGGTHVHLFLVKLKELCYVDDRRLHEKSIIDDEEFKLDVAIEGLIEHASSVSNSQVIKEVL